MLALAILASSIFPQQIDNHLTLGYDPVCTICHDSLNGGTGTVTQPFGMAMQDAGLEPGNVTSLQAALDALDAADSDVDADGVEDIQELRDGTNPNPGLEPPEYGCIGSVAPAGNTFAGAALALAAAILATRRRS